MRLYFTVLWSQFLKMFKLSDEIIVPLLAFDYGCSFCHLIKQIAEHVPWPKVENGSLGSFGKSITYYYNVFKRQLIITINALLSEFSPQGIDVLSASEEYSA